MQKSARTDGEDLGFGARGLVLCARCSVLGALYSLHRTLQVQAVNHDHVWHGSGTGTQGTRAISHWDPDTGRLRLRIELCKFEFGKDGHGQREISD